MKKANISLLVLTLCFLSGCATLFKDPIVQHSYFSQVYTKTIIIDSSVSEQVVLEKIKEQLERDTSVIPGYHEIYYGENSSYQPSFHTQGVYVSKFVTGNSNAEYDVTLKYKRGYKVVDPRSSEYPALYSDWELFAYNKAHLTVTIFPTDCSVVYTITTLPEVTWKDEIWVIESVPSYPILAVEHDLQERIQDIRISVPRTILYCGEVTLTNDDETAFANVKRILKDACVSTNNKNEIEKSGTVQINGLEVSFTIYPYKTVSKMKYSFICTYIFTDDGGNTLDDNIQFKIETQLTDIMNS